MNAVSSLDADAVTRLVSPFIEQEDVRAEATAAGIDEALLILIRALAVTRILRGDAPEQFVRMLAAVPDTTAPGHVAHRWLAWSIAHPVYGFAGVLTDADDAAVLKRAIAAHQADATSPATWRALRKDVAALSERAGSRVRKAALRAIGGGSWSLAAMPGAVADAFLDWTDAQTQATYQDMAFTMDELRTFAERNYEAWDTARETLTASGDLTNDRHLALNRALLIERHPAVGERGYAVMDARDARTAAAVECGMAELIVLGRPNE